MENPMLPKSDVYFHVLDIWTHTHICYLT